MSSAATTPNPDGLDRVRAAIATIPDFPKAGIEFKDFFPVFRDPLALEALAAHLTSHLLNLGKKVDVIVGIDSRGFLLGPLLALRIGASFVPVRKPGKLPGKVSQASYEKEYGVDTLEIQTDAIAPGQNVVILDDLAATGGTARAAGQLVRGLEANLLEYLFVIELEFLNARAVLDAPVYAPIKY
ncbi:adenine phosphoribosyltransferase [Blastocladiella emersonii ATCC 22665]|nr:adenine phosphoribosyltransferase [Blastocladiella emersonii ATCC 22665]